MGLLRNAQLRQHYATFEPKIELDRDFVAFMVKKNELVIVAGLTKESTTK